MRVEQELVKQFMTKIGDAAHDAPEVVEPAVAERRYRLIKEELREYRAANAAGDLVAIADALGDLLYTVLGAFVLHGIDAQPVFGEIHKSNMTKEPLNNVVGIDGGYKLCRKGEAFERPRLAEVLFLQRHNELPEVLR